MHGKFFTTAAVGLLCSPLALAAPPNFHSNTCPLTLDGTTIGTALTPGASSLRNTIAYDPATQRYHFWGFTADDPNFPSAASALTAVTHATSIDGVHFISDGHLSYEIGSLSYADFGADIDPPLDFFRAAFDEQTGTWKLFAWTENDQVVTPSFGKYNYNSSVNDIGATAGSTSVVHQGPLDTPVAGNHVGSFGLVDGLAYLRVDSATGGNGQFAYTDGLPASTGSELGEADLFTGTPYCWLLQATCGTAADPRIPGYVHNVGRTLRQDDGTLGTYYAFRHSDGSRADKQIWYVESDDDGLTWSAPVGVFTDGNLVTIAGQPLDADAGTANFSSVEVVQGQIFERAYFSTQDANGAYVMVASRADRVTDRVFSGTFEVCDL